MTKLKDLLKEFDSVSDKEAKMPFSKLKDKDIDNDGDTDKADSYLHKKLGVVALKTEDEISEAYVPDNIKKFAKQKGVGALVNKIAGWAEKSGKRLYGGTAIGKNYSTLILDLTYQGGEVRINTDDNTVEVYGEEVNSFNEFKSALANQSMNEMGPNDPVMMKLRAKKDAKHTKPTAKAPNPNQRKIDQLKKRRANIIRDMEQEAELEGGPIADEYADKLSMIDIALRKLNEQSTSDVVTFSIDDDKLDTLLHAKFSNYIDYIDDDHLDSYYTMPQRQFDRFIDLADSSGFDTDELIQMNEMSTTAGAPGYETPFAFGAADDETLDQAGYKKVKTKKNESTYKQMMNQLHEMRYSEYKNDTTATPKTKVNKSISEVNRLLGEIEKIVHRNMRLKTEEGVNSSDYWKNTSKNFGKISERLVRINNKLRELSQ
jgi:hypothetical protein